MVRAIRYSRRILSSCASAVSKTLDNNGIQSQSRNATSTFHSPSRPYATAPITTSSPFKGNVLRILRKEIDYQTEYAPPHQPATKFNSYTVEDQSGKQLMMMKAKFGDAEDIEIKVSMFDAFDTVPKSGEDSTGENVRLHVSLLVSVSKEDCSDVLECWCSAWPDSLAIHKVYVRSHDSKRACLYKGPHVGSLSAKLQKVFSEYLEARGVNEELCAFLHGYMMNKDRMELIAWLGKVQSVVER